MILNILTRVVLKGEDAMDGRVSVRRSGVIRSLLCRLFVFSFLLISVYGGCNGGGGITPPPTPTAPPTSTLLSAVLIETGDEPVSCDDPIWNEAEEISVVTSTVVFGNLYGDGQLNMTGTLGATINFNRGNPADLRLTGLYTSGSGQIFIRARWNDVIFNLDRRRALYNGPADPDKTDDPAGPIYGTGKHLVPNRWVMQQTSLQSQSMVVGTMPV
jgi:hypothetical protein